MVTETVNRLNEIVEYVLCKASPIYFIEKYCFIKSTEGEFLPFKLYKYQRKSIIDLLLHNLIVVLKNRQIGWTWLIAAYALWKAIFFKASNVIIVSKSEEAASEVLDYMRFMYMKLPPFLKPRSDRDRMTLLSFPDIASKVRALSATTASSIGFGSASLIILDENDFHPYAEENYIEIKPMIDAGGSRQLVILSAPNREKMNSSFKGIWRNAVKGLNNFHPILCSFGVVPYHTEEWLEARRKEYPAREIETRYFKTEEEALSVTTAGKFFDADKLVLHTNRILNPISNYPDLDLRNGIIRIYKPPMPGGRYVLFCDPSEGKEDPFHIVVAEIFSNEEVANAHGWIPSDEVAVIYDALCTHYNNPYNSFMRTGYTGGRFQNSLDNFHIQNQAYARATDGTEKIGQFGYWESGPLKKDLLGNLRAAVYSLEIIIHDTETLDEFNTMIWIEGAETPTVPDRGHDDRITAWQGAYDLLKRVPKIGFKLKTIDIG